MNQPVQKMATLRALSRACLSAEAFLPAALEALHGVVPSYRNLFDWTDAQGEIVRYYFEGPIDHRIAALYFEEFHNRREGEVMPQFRQSINGRAVIRSAQELDRPEFFRSALYNEIWRPQGLHTRVEAIVRNARGKVLGSLVLYRAAGDRHFTREEEALVEQAAGYLARGIEAGSNAEPAEIAATTPRKRATLNLGPQGELLHMSQDALKLLMLSHGGVTPDSVSRQPVRQDFATLNLLWEHHLRGRSLSREGLSLTIDNAWGRFEFESEVLASLNAGQPPLIQVGIRHYEPTVVSLRRALDRLPLSNTQRDVCAMLQRGDSQAEIAAELSIATSTVADHVRKIYTKLDVHSVHELGVRIRQAGTGSAG